MYSVSGTGLCECHEMTMLGKNDVCKLDSVFAVTQYLHCSGLLLCY